MFADFVAQMDAERAGDMVTRRQGDKGKDRLITNHTNKKNSTNNSWNSSYSFHS